MTRSELEERIEELETEVVNLEDELCNTAEIDFGIGDMRYSTNNFALNLIMHKLRDRVIKDGHAKVLQLLEN